MEDEQEDSRVPTAREFLKRHRPFQKDLGSASRDAYHEDRYDDEDEDNKAGDQRRDDGELEVDGPGSMEVMMSRRMLSLEFLHLRSPLSPLARSMAKGVAHPPVPRGHRSRGAHWSNM